MRTLWVLVLLIFLSSAQAHEIRPAYLKISEQAEGYFEVSWKQPVLSGRRLKIEPVFPQDCERDEAKQHLSSFAITQNFELKCSLREGEISIDGLGKTITDVFVEINYLDQETLTKLLKPRSPVLDISKPAGVGTAAYFIIGVEHIIFGWDHLLFVIGLVLLINRSQVLWVVTSFTLAHSLTLALASFDILNVPTRPVEILIALSVLLLALEVIYKQRGRETFTAQNPHLVSFMVGLIHGCGFASALSDIGLPNGTEILALLLFNMGVEVGQLFVIVIFLIILATLSKFSLKLKNISQIGLTYMLGGIAVFWILQRLSGYLIV